MPSPGFFYNLPQPLQPRRYAPIPAQGDQPPRHTPALMMEAVLAWPTGLEYQPYQPRPRIAAIPPPVVNNPPPKQSLATLYGILGAWNPPPPQPTQRRAQFPFPSAIVVVTFVPFTRLPQAIMNSWNVPPFVMPPRSPPVTPSGTKGVDKEFVNRIVGPGVDVRLRRHSELVAAIFNSLIRQGQLVQLGAQEWTIDPGAIPPIVGGSGPTGTFTSNF